MATITKKPTRRKVGTRRTAVWQDAGIDFARVRREVGGLLRYGLSEYQLLLNRRLIEEVEQDFQHWLTDLEHNFRSQLKHIPKSRHEEWISEKFALQATKGSERRQRTNQTLRHLVDFLFDAVHKMVHEVEAMKSSNRRFRAAFDNVRIAEERQQLILNYGRELGRTDKELRGDQRAFARWFDVEAVIEQYSKRVGKAELRIIFLMDRLSEVVDQVIWLAHRNTHQATRAMDTEQTIFKGQTFFKGKVSGISDSGLKLTASDDQVALCGRLRGLWQRLRIEQRVQEMLDYDGEPRVHVAVLSFLARCLHRLPAGLGRHILSDRIRIKSHRAAMDCTLDVWIQCEAINVLCGMDFEAAVPVLQKRIKFIKSGDDMFVRRHVWRLFERKLLHGFDDTASDDTQPTGIRFEDARRESSSFVKQKIADVAFLSRQRAGREHWRHLVRSDQDPKVRAAGLLSGLRHPQTGVRLREYLHELETCLEREEDPFVLRTSMHCVRTESHRLLGAGVSVGRIGSVDDAVEAVDLIRESVLPKLRQMESTSRDLAVRRWAAQTAEFVRAEIDPECREWLSQLKPRLRALQPGSSIRIPKHELNGIETEQVGRMLAVLAQDDFGYDLRRGWFGARITRGPTFGFRLWRLLYEMRNPATDKRQAYRHTIGRISTATLRAPSQILGELSETKVPGEPLTIASEGSWRPYLPLVDDFVSILNMSWFVPRRVQFYTSQGVTKVTGPRGLLSRMQAAWKLNTRFGEYADQRNWDEDSAAPNAYVQSMRGLGFELEFCPYDAATTEDGVDHDPSVTRFFKQRASVPVLFGGMGADAWRWAESFADYFTSSFENTIEQLVVFAIGILIFLVARHTLAVFRLRRARNSIPLSIGGWGTRGKSGTERLKCALLGATGHGVVSKTTGCEAMFIHGFELGEPLEIPLFRPYDKATIWEQQNLIRLAAKLEPSVFLWECMALTPSYVDVLQRQWTRDEIGTITNTYPDHEDLQGPAGHDVATTISGFVPEEALLISTEEVMRPYLTDACRDVKSDFRGVGWLESGLITKDVIDRFPYQEHPDNIALVATLGDELGYDYDYCLKMMADSLVPDLGVLKTHAPASVRTRQLEFTNGMSANERFGCMGNWRRLGFSELDAWEQPTTWVTCVVNNRADRVARSKVFSKILVEDIRADRYFLIGGNLQGLMGFIDEAWQQQTRGLTLRNAEHDWDRQFALSALKQAARDYRQPTEQHHVVAQLEHMLSTLTGEVEDISSAQSSAVDRIWESPEEWRQLLVARGADPDCIEAAVSHHRDLLLALNEYRELVAEIEKATSAYSQNVEAKFASVLRSWFDRKIVIIKDYAATGDEIVDTIADATPPGFLNRIMGMQNIKGTGLDFVYAFQAWDVCHDACLAATRQQPQIVEKALSALVSMPKIGLLCQESIEGVLEVLAESPLIRAPDTHRLYQQLRRKLEAARKAPTTDTTHSGNSSTEPNDTSRPIDAADGQCVAQPDAETDEHQSAENQIGAIRTWILQNAEEFLDVHDAVRRRKTADQIYRDLANERISRQRAVLELRRLNKRQKGGWFRSKFSKAA